MVDVSGGAEMRLARQLARANVVARATRPQRPPAMSWQTGSSEAGTARPSPSRRSCGHGRRRCRVGKKVAPVLSHLHSWMWCLRVQIRPSPPPRLLNTICPFDEANQVESYRRWFRIRILQLPPISTRPPTQRPLEAMLSFTSSSTSRSRADLVLPDTGDRHRIWLTDAGTLKKFLERFKQKQQCQ